MENQSKEKSLIRPALSRDAEWIKKIYAKNKKHLGSFDLWQSWHNYLVHGKGMFKVLPNFGFVRYAYMSKYSAYVIHEIGVAEDMLGRGYGKQLLLSVPLPILLKCDKENEDGNAFYKAIGMNCAGLTSTKKGKPQIIWTKSS